MTATSSMPRLTEAQFQRQVTDLAEICGWSWAHFRPARTEKGWRVPVSGPMGKGWVDLVMVRARDRRLIFAELKAQVGYLTREQTDVLLTLRALDHQPIGTLREAGGRRHNTEPRIEVHVWRPSDFPEIEAALR